MTPEDFQLDPRLEAESFPLGRFTLCEVRLFNDSRFPWLILVPARAGLVDIIDLDEAGRQILMREVALSAGALKTVTRCHKLNVAALGNQVRQLHVHVIARFESDAAWPNPVWGRGARVAYEPQAAAKFAEQMRSALGKAPAWRQNK
jgi:diadenosine tetraphosphate (Ap4A) HIT family hydrolase